jgi:gluconolactonase
MTQYNTSFLFIVSSILQLVAAAPLTAQDRSIALPMVAEGAQLTKIADGFKFTEGPAVNAEGDVFFTDQPNDRILKWSEGKDIETWLEPAGRSNGLFFLPDGDLLACADGKNELWRIHPDKSHDVIAKGFEDRLFNGPNDVWAYGSNAIYFTDPLYPRPYWEHRNPESQLPKRIYMLSQDGKVQVAAEDFEQPNGIVGDAERKQLFVADIGARKTFQFSINDDGSLSDRKLFCEEGSDGMTLDRDGNLYLTGRGVLVCDKHGEQVGTIPVPKGWTANVCFGGHKRDILFITASDSVYNLKMNVQGL